MNAMFKQSKPGESAGARFWKTVLHGFGWTLHFNHPEFDRYVLIVAPHTSNWDFPLGIAAKWALGLKPRFLGKHSLFKPPLGWFFRRLGGIPVNRTGHNDMISQMTHIFDGADNMVLALAPEGTRGATQRWRSGFWHIAKAARVPVVMAYIDYSTKRIGGGEFFVPGEDIDQDFVQIRAFYKSRRGKTPSQESTIRRMTDD